ncbi:Type I restriction-modification system, specificity subunit S [Lacticaseibacillus paracasei]|uniref:Restriction endonuclease subunit S n=1 Tax=Lacticaseibacillus paracasei TaxID=1597 RepID=A0AAP4N7V7_LACPA|nr:restriction endonuclease subunit S [Lacticaseibacillus paracasei]AGP68951.1 Type I restriction-modification system, specificity subunit S [Lacticaseibacillus paracasei]EPC25344.1 Type I restriction-modification system, specificity subunit S [Lacticaseibacillus paracasei subsp. paracasei Lpp46]MDM7454780.1 restriction endonuclease subunit S [Lacticaseibacillus paracasei]
MVVDVFEVLLARNAWEKRKWSQLVGISKNMVDPTTGKYDSLIHIGPGNIRSNSRELVDLKTVKDENLISGKFHFDKGDIIYGKINPQLAKYTIAPAEGLSSADTYVLKPKSGIERLFLYYTLGTNRFFKYTVSVSQRTGMPKINRDELNAYSLIIAPSLFEQKRIGLFLRKTDDLIAATQRRIDALEQAKKALLQRLFDQSWRFKGYSDPWEKRKLGETNSYFTDGNYGESYPKESELSDKENGVPFLRGSNLRNGELIEDNANYITKEKHAELTSGHLVEDDIVLAVRGSLGALGYVKDENIDWNINSQLAVIRTDKSELSGKFLVQFLLSWRGQKELLSRNTGTALKQLPIKQLKDVPVPIVNLDEQKEIGALFSSIDNLIAATQSRLSSLELLKKSLLQDLFI